MNGVRSELLLVDVGLVLVVVASLVPVLAEWLLQRRRRGRASGSVSG